MAKKPKPVQPPFVDGQKAFVGVRGFDGYPNAIRVTFTEGTWFGYEIQWPSTTPKFDTEFEAVQYAQDKWHCK
jgi:hypothetical protein